MTEGPTRVLVIDDEEVVQDVLRTLLEAEGLSVTIAADAEQGLLQLREIDFALVLLDLMLPGMSGLDALTELKQQDPDLPVIMVTAFATVQNAIDAMKRGAFDYQIKPFRNDELLIVVRRALAAQRLQAENRNLRRQLRDRFQLANIIGRSSEMVRLIELIEQAAPSRSTILVEGESGTGKELVARAIHYASPRAEGPFVVMSCSNLPAESQESHLFGHERGAFHGAVKAHRGLFEKADGGSLFLDEVSSIGQDVQAKLLRALQEREVVRLGSTEPVKVDARIIAATHADLRAAVAAGTFRQDLYYRLKVISIEVPPLRDRSGDVALLAAHFIQQYSRENERRVPSLSAEALRLLESHDWPGNVRELENVIQKAVVLCRGEEIGPDLVSDDVNAGRNGRGRPRWPTGANYKDVVDEFERDVITQALRDAEGVQKRAAELLGLKATTLNEKIKRLQIRYRP